MNKFLKNAKNLNGEKINKSFIRRIYEKILKIIKN